MHPRRRSSPVRRMLAAALTAGLLLPAIGRAEESPADAALPDTHWYDGPLRVTDVVVDLVIIRPCAALTLVTGGVLFVPAAVMTAPNGLDGIRDAWERFISEPGEYLWARPLGEL